MRSPIARIFAATATLLLASSAFADDTNDLVVLSNGGRVRGTVVEQSPATGVRIKLYDGSVRSFASAEIARVQYADGASPAQPQLAVIAPLAPMMRYDGTLAVRTTEPATITVDDTDEAEAPTRIEHLDAGRHVVRVAFLAGGSLSRAFRVRPGEVTEADIEPSDSIKIGRAHSGTHFGFGGAAGFRLQRQTFVPGGSVRGGASWGLTQALELHLNGDVGYYSGSIQNPDYVALFGDRMPECTSDQRACFLTDATQTSIPVRGRLDLEVHLGTVYSMMLGADAGLSVELQGATGHATDTAPIVPNVQVLPLAGIHGSLLTLNFGPKRELGVSVQQGALFGSGAPVFEQTLADGRAHV